MGKVVELVSDFHFECCEGVREWKKWERKKKRGSYGCVDKLLRTFVEYLFYVFGCSNFRERMR